MRKHVTLFVCALLCLAAAGVYWRLRVYSRTMDAEEAAAQAAAPSARGSITFAPGTFAVAPQAPAAPVEDEPAGRALYEAMVAAYRGAQSLSYDGKYSFGRANGGYRQDCAYTILLKKPNYVRMEASLDGALKGVLIGDGETFWTYWPDGRMRYGWEHDGERAAAYEQTKMTSYMTHPAPLGLHSIGHDAGKLGAGIAMLVFDPSTFHGYTDSLQRYLDGVRSAGTEKIGEEECDVIDLSFMKGQRVWRIWISKADRIPRRFHEWVHVSSELFCSEDWSNVIVNGDIENDKFAWAPPEGWTEYRLPAIEEGLLKPGTPAPDFELPVDGGGTFKLSDNRGKVIWIFVWRAG